MWRETIGQTLGGFLTQTPKSKQLQVLHGLGSRDECVARHTEPAEALGRGRGE